MNIENIKRLTTEQLVDLFSELLHSRDGVSFTLVVDLKQTMRVRSNMSVSGRNLEDWELLEFLSMYVRTLGIPVEARKVVH